jgi:hypothetical protein
VRERTFSSIKPDYSLHTARLGGELQLPPKIAVTTYLNQAMPTMIKM